MCLWNRQNFEWKIKQGQKWGGGGSKNRKLTITNFLVYSWQGSAVVASTCVFGLGFTSHIIWKIFSLGNWNRGKWNARGRNENDKQQKLSNCWLPCLLMVGEEQQPLIASVGWGLKAPTSWSNTWTYHHHLLLCLHSYHSQVRMTTCCCSSAGHQVAIQSIWEQQLTFIWEQQLNWKVKWWNIWCKGGWWNLK